MKKVRKISFFQILAIVLAFATGIALWTFILGESGLWNQHKMKTQIALLETEAEALRADSLRKAKESRLFKDPFYIETVARTKYGLSKKGEVVYQFIDD